MTDFTRDLNVIVQNVEINHKGRIRFPMRHFDRIADRSVKEMSLGTRAENALGRNGFKTFNDIAKRINKLNARGAGVKTIKEVKNAYMSYYYDNLNETERKDFWRDVVEATENM